MSVYYSTEAFVFKKEDRQDANREFSVFTRDFGRVEVVGRAIRKINSKLRQGIDVFSFCEIEFIQGKQKKTLTDAIALQKFESLQSPEKFLVACRIGKVLHQCIRGQQKDEALYELLQDVFLKLKECKETTRDRQMVFEYFFWNAISLLGYSPEFSCCVSCGGKLDSRNIYFSSQEGGLMCQACKSTDLKAMKVSPEVIKIIRLVLKKDWQILEKLKVSPAYLVALRTLGNSYYTYLVASNSFFEI